MSTSYRTWAMFTNVVKVCAIPLTLLLMFGGDCGRFGPVLQWGSFSIVATIGIIGFTAAALERLGLFSITCPDCGAKLATPASSLKRFFDTTSFQDCGSRPSSLKGVFDIASYNTHTCQACRTEFRHGLLRFRISRKALPNSRRGAGPDAKR